MIAFSLTKKHLMLAFLPNQTGAASGNRDTIMVPAEILNDFILALQEVKATADQLDY